MNEKFSAEPAEKRMIIQTLKEGESTGWEGEHEFTTEEVMSGLKGLLGVNEEQWKKIEITSQFNNDEGRIVSMSMRAEGSMTGYAFRLKGVHKRVGSSNRTLIECIDYVMQTDKNSGVQTEIVYFAEEIGEYKEGAWKKSE